MDEAYIEKLQRLIILKQYLESFEFEKDHVNRDIFEKAIEKVRKEIIDLEERVRNHKRAKTVN
jgi:predicted sulfurtransferase